VIYYCIGIVDSITISLFFKKGKETNMQKFDYEVYTGNDLGAVYSPKMTRFKVWAPEAESVKLNLYKQGEGDNLIEQHIMAVISKTL